MDDARGCAILSGDELLEALCDELRPKLAVFLTDVAGVRAVRGYLAWLEDASRDAHAAGLTAADAVTELAVSEAFAPYREWGEWERLAVNVRAAYREIDGGDEGIPGLFEAMAALAAGRSST